MRTPTWQQNEKHWGLRPTSRWSGVIAAGRTVGAELRMALSEGVRARRLRRLAAHTHPRVSLGSGTTVPPGWIGLDAERTGPAVHRWDLRRGLPFGTGTVTGYLLEHSLEHIYLDDARRLLRECYRTLRPGAPIRIVSPDVRFLVEVVAGGTQDWVREQIGYDQEIHRWVDEDELDLFVVNRLSHQWGAHLGLLSAPWVARMLEKFGFAEITTVSPDTSKHFDRAPSTHRDRFPGPDHEAFAVEAVRPGGDDR
ncbi:class I SAM-dependent methyltransferase [Saccharomonospora azurea]|uniref:class I SAM-dependent methyltransferase n=1 Tax=Saccharomonospora azurea TaxID=40988 RepID=UPI003D917BA2